MDRKWRFNREALLTLQSLRDFIAELPNRSGAPMPDLASVSDIYAVYTILHIENRQVEVQWSSEGQFYFIVAVQHAYQRQNPPAAAPEGDEDPPEVVPVEEEPEEALELVDAEGEVPTSAPRAASSEEGSPGAPTRPAADVEMEDVGDSEQAPADGSQKAGSGNTCAGTRQQHQNGLPAVAQEVTEAATAVAEQEQPQADGQEQEQQGAEHPQSRRTDGGVLEDVQQPLPQTDGGPQAEAAAAVLVSTRTQILVPVSSGYPAITPELLQRLFSIRGVKAQQLLLALVDSHGVVTRNCLYNYIQAPLEGPGTADLVLMEEEGEEKSA